MLSADGPDLSPALAWVESVAGPVTAARELVGGMTSVMVALSTASGEELVLRLMTREPWRRHGAALTAREREIQEMLEAADVPAPRTRALDAEGLACGFPAHLMTLLPGQIEPDRVDDESLDHLAGVLAGIHQVSPTIEVRTYESWAWEAKHVVPAWSADPDLWEVAFALLRTDPPDFEPRFLHRDFQANNVLWSQGRISGVVDWVETSIGPAWLDVAHCCTNIAFRHGSDRADAFADSYVARTGVASEPYFDVMDIVGFLPPPGSEAVFFMEPYERRRLEERLRSVMLRVAGGS